MGRFFVVIRSTLFVAILALCQSLQADSIKARIDRYVQSQIDDGTHVGAVIGVIQNNKTEIWSYGVKRLGSAEAPDEQTLFEIGSVSKVFTGIALASLAQEGSVKLDDPASKFLSELENPSVGSITLLELSTHTSGLPRLPDNLNPSDPANPYRDFDPLRLLDFLSRFEVQEKPSAFELKNYSNLGVGLLGYLLSRAAESPYAELIRTRITDPLGMSETTIELSQQQAGRVAQGYDSVIEEASLWDLSILAGAGGIRSTARDLLRFLEANLSPDGSLVGQALATSHQTYRSGLKDSIGLGWLIKGEGKNAVLWHNGMTGGYYSFVAFSPARRLGLVVLTNTAAPLHCIKEAVFEEECKLEPEYRHTEQELVDFTGRYEFEANFFLDIIRKGNFLVLQESGFKVRMKAVAASKFFVGDERTTVRFERNAEEIVHRLILNQNGLDRIASRIK